MRKFLFVLTIVFLVFSTSPIYAGTPDQAAGEWRYIISDFDMKEVGGNSIMTTFDEGLRTGTFEGVSTEVGKMVIHRTGKRFFIGRLTFDGEVDGKPGTFRMFVVGRKLVDQDWTGHWVILSRSEELANLHGRGIWFGPGAGCPFVWGTVAYKENYHFGPGK